jgi:hypothetical protein
MQTANENYRVTFLVRNETRSKTFANGHDATAYAHYLTQVHYVSGVTVQAIEADGSTSFNIGFNRMSFTRGNR